MDSSFIVPRKYPGQFLGAAMHHQSGVLNPSHSPSNSLAVPCPIGFETTS